MSQFLIESTRSGSVESIHHVSAAVVTPEGHLKAAAGDPEFPTVARSTAKPFQALPILQDGAAQRFSITSPELALACASHNSELYQVEIVRGLLARIGCTENDLACGPHKPLGATYSIPPLERSVMASPSPLASNCSGKHAGMLALAKHHGWDTAGYQAAGHPVQTRIKREIARWAGIEAAHIVEGEDGCTAVTFTLPLFNMALAIGRLATSEGRAERAVVSAMVSNPALIAGANRLESELVSAYHGAVVAKVGAEGVYLAALPNERLGIALKVEDGDALCAMVALVALLDQLGLDPPASTVLPGFAEMPVLNTRGKPVGSLRPSGGVEFK